MKSIIKSSSFIFLIGILFYVSCKKERSCESCNDKNKSPIAIAGPDQVITLPTDSVLLDGNASSDPDGTISSFLWKKISGPASFNIIKASDSTTRVKALVAGIYQFELKVTDNGGLSAKDTITIAVDAVPPTNHPPIANAGADQTIILPTNTANLDGSGSTDPDNNIASYAWTKISRSSSFTIVNGNSIQTQIINLVQGIYELELRVTDLSGLFSLDTIQIIVTDVVPQPSQCIPGSRPIVPARLVPVTTNPGDGMAVAAAGNKILFAGGSPGNPPTTSTANIYDIVAGVWTTIQLSQARTDMGVAVLGNKIYLAGGNIPVQLSPGSWGYNGTTSKAIDIYDALTNTWATDQLLYPQAPIGATANDKVVFAGGDYYWPSIFANIFNATGRSWSAATLSSGRRILAATTIGNKIFFAGGDYPNDGFTSNIDIYDASSNTWTVDHFSPPFDQGWAPTGIAVGNKNYWAGGWYYSPDIYVQPTAHVEIRDESTHTSAFDCLFQPNYGFSAVLKDDKIIFFTGQGVEKNKFDIYDTATNTWSIGVLPQNVEGASIISVNNIIYVAGGKINGVLSNQVWRLEF